MNNQINKNTNTDTLTRQEMIAEARLSKNRSRVKLIEHMHIKLAQAAEFEQTMETAYGYDPLNDNSFTGEFEAIGA